jgi:predicted MFS family arabinose efflux permease
LVLDQPVAPEQCSYLLSLIGVSSTVGRILFGFLSDFERCNRLMLYSHCLLLCGLATALTPFAHNYWLLGLFCIIFGLTTGK